jgi:L-threonylcarbamoyladenylate synthase
VARVFAAKQRPHFDPLIVHLAEKADLGSVVANVPAAAQQLIDRFWPGPLTLVLPKRECIPDLVTSGLPSVGIRVPDHPQARELIRLSGGPIAAPSANLFGRISPTTAQHVLDQLQEEIDFVLDGGPCRVGLESTVLQLREDAPPLLLRPGGTTMEDLTAVLGVVVTPLKGIVPENLAQAGPGMLEQHYAPQKPLRLLSENHSSPPGQRAGLLAFDRIPAGSFTVIERLSENGSLEEAAANFFAALRRLDAAEIDIIAAMEFPDRGLGRALNDRLRRAAAQSGPGSA